MTELPNGLRIFTVQRMVNGEIRTYNIAARNAADAAKKADESATQDRSQQNHHSHRLGHTRKVRGAR